jgi:hypothetical protein
MGAAFVAIEDRLPNAVSGHDDTLLPEINY